MSEYMLWFWLIIFIVAIVIEFSTTELVSLWFAIAAVIAMIISLANPTNVWLQVIVFFTVGFILMGVTRPFLVKYFKRNVIDTNVDAFIGKAAQVIVKISHTEHGKVLFEGTEWTAVSSETIDDGAMVRILAIEGNKLIVTKIEEKEK